MMPECCHLPNPATCVDMDQIYYILPYGLYKLRRD